MNEYTVSCVSKAGMYAQYSFDIRVHAEDEEQAINKAYDKLSMTFPDRNRFMWRFSITNAFYLMEG